MLRILVDFNPIRHVDSLKGALAQLLMRESKPLPGVTKSGKPVPASS